MSQANSGRFENAVIVVLALVACLAFGAPAKAGTYTVNTNFCDWSADANGWSGGLSGGCNDTKVIIEQTYRAPIGTYQWWRSNALPLTLNLNTAVYNASWHKGGTNDQPFETRLCNAGPYGTTTSPCAGNMIDYWPGLSNAGVIDRANNCSVAMTGPGQPQTCKGFLFARFTTGGQANGGAQLSFLRFTIADFTAPAVSTTLASQAISQGNWLRGAVATGASAADTSGSGIKSMTFSVLDSLPQSITSTKSCYYGALIPCPTSSSFTNSFDTTTVADGSHTARYSATDAGDMTGTSGSFTFKVDNTRPETPTSIAADVTGQNGWSSVNSIGASWTNGAEELETATQSGIDAVVVDVNPTDGAQANPAPVTVPVGGTVSGISATRTGVSGVALPSAGAYSLRLQLVDKAGNVSDVGDGSGGSADSDVAVGYDPNAPTKPLGQANGWISRDELAAGYDQTFTYTAGPTAFAPVCGFAGSVDQNEGGTTGSSINVPGGPGIRTYRLPGTLIEATHYVHLRAVSCNGIVTPQAETNTTEAKVDRTDPVGSVSGVENGRWYKDGQQVTLSATDALSGMAPAPSDDPLSTKGAYLSYTVNGNGPIDEDAPRGDSANISVTGEGQKELRFSPVDFAGNKAAAKAVSFGIDATNPIGYVDFPSEARPTLLAATLGDVPSGVSYAIFAIRPRSGGAWEKLPTSLTGADGSAVGAGTSSGIATARFPDTDKPAGTYDVRVSAFDQAGNELTTSRYKDGSAASVENPMRKQTGLSVKLFKALRSCSAKTKNGKKVKCVVKKCTKKSKGTCYKVLRGRVVLVGGSASVTSEFKRGAVAAGVLSGEDGKPLANTEVTIATTEKFSGRAATVGSVKTDENGLYSLRVPAGVSRTVTAIYAGTETRRPASSSANMLTRAKVTLKISKKRAKTGQSVTFSGQVTAFDRVIPSGGKIVGLQFYAAKKWRPAVAVAHTDSKGRFKIKYTFDGAKVKAKIIFRVATPSEDGWGHTASYSKTKVIRLNF